MLFAAGWIDDVNPIPVMWFWRGLRGHSVTFAVLFASLVLGASISGGVGRVLAALGIHWLYVLILPAVLFGWIAKREPYWLPDERRRRRLARATLLGALALAGLIMWLRPARPNPADRPREPAGRPAGPRSP